ncbi:OmpP1/FadL family transporter [Alkalimarinus sediminis]|uniref:Outer membrane protein transport protein n=1 Tax=Alkalimarinus sediminis TaxID=1632866 RepID=A0A9E8HJT2_9ALTE|nr:outer membrane protein transport protein [Alkalimarinus sediminis]UZW74652.1 outer membrane protein transport protein [Alkalimarinus sediminis]
MSLSPRVLPRTLLWSSLSSILVAQNAIAVGFMINPTSNLTGIANAGSAVYDHSTAAISNNPAAMSLMSQKQIGGNFSLVVPDWSVNEQWDCAAEGNCAKSNVSPIAAIPTIGLIRPMDNDFTWGVGLGAIAGAGMDYGSNFKTRPIITENKLQVLELMNSISWRMDEQWTFGVGVGVLHGSFEQKQDLPSLNGNVGDDLSNAVEFAGLVSDRQCRDIIRPGDRLDCYRTAAEDAGIDPASTVANIDALRSYAGGATGTTVDLEGDDIGAEITLGTTFEFSPGHRLGLAYHYLTDFTFEGSATINGQLLSNETYQKQHTTLTWDMPERLIISGSHRVNNDLNLYWDFERVFFDSFKSTDLRIDGYHTIRIDRNFKDANRYAIGGEYGLNERTTLQLGFSYDESPVDDADRMADIPVDDIFKTAFGTIYQVNEQLDIHGYVSLEFLGDAQIEQLASISGTKIGNSVKMDSDAVLYVFGVSFGYKF